MAPSDGRNSVANRVLWLVLAVLVGAHALALLSPLRINQDTVLLLKMVEAVQDGRGWNPPEVGSQHPIGYPAMVVGLEKLGIANPVTLVGLNVGFMLVGMWATLRVLRRSFPQWVEVGGAGPGGGGNGLARSLFLVVLTGASWVMVKHVAIPITDVVYFGVSSLTLLALMRVWNPLPSERPMGVAGKAGMIVLGVVLVGVSLLTRTVGIALLPALGWAVVASPGRVDRVLASLRAKPVLMAGSVASVLVAGVVLAFVVTQTTYWTGFVKQYQGATLGEAVSMTAEYRLMDLGQTVLNVPAAVVPERLHGVVMMAGLVAYLGLALGLWRSRRFIAPAHVYFAAYSAIVLIWPFADPRFWLPIVPLTGALVLEAAAPAMRFAPGRWLAGAYAALFVALGCGALVVSTKVTFSGERFPDAYAKGGPYTDAYRKAWGQPHDEAKVVEDVVRLLKRYGGRGR